MTDRKSELSSCWQIVIVWLKKRNASKFGLVDKYHMRLYKTVKIRMLWHLLQ